MEPVTGDIEQPTKIETLKKFLSKESLNTTEKRDEQNAIKKVEPCKPPAPTKASLARQLFIRNRSLNNANKQETVYETKKANSKPGLLIRNDSNFSDSSKISKASNKTFMVGTDNTNKIQPMTRGNSLNAILHESQHKVKALQKEYSKLSERTNILPHRVSMKDLSHTSPSKKGSTEFLMKPTNSKLNTSSKTTDTKLEKTFLKPKLDNFGEFIDKPTKKPSDYFDSDTEVGGELDLEHKAMLDLENMELKISKNINTCIDIVRANATMELEVFLNNMEKKQPREQLKLMVELVKKLCEQNLQQKQINQELHEEVKEIRSQNNLLTEKIKHFQQDTGLQSKQKIHEQDEIICELKAQLESVNTQFQKCKLELEEKKSKIDTLKYNHDSQLDEVEKLKTQIQNLENLSKQDHFSRAGTEMMNNQIINLKRECDEANTKMKTYETQIKKLEQDLSETLCSRNRGSEKIAALEKEVQELRGRLTENLGEKKQVKRKMLGVVPEEDKNELKRCRQNDKSFDIKNLQTSLNEAHATIVKLETENRHLQELMEARLEHIKSLEKNCNHQRVEIDEMLVSLSEKNRVIGELHNEMRVKNEDFQNMFSTLGNKQLEMSKEMQNICSIRESYDCSQRLRIAHEEKIACLESEIEKLKSKDSKKEETYYQDEELYEQRHKRHNRNIHVKKYTT